MTSGEENGRVKGLRYSALRGISRDVVDDIEKVARLLVEQGACEVQLLSTITHFLRVAMVDLTPRGKFIEDEVDWRVSPPMWKFYFMKQDARRVPQRKNGK